MKVGISIGVISKEITVNPADSDMPLAVSLIDTASCSPLGRIIRRTGASITSQVKTRESFGHTPLAVHLSSLKLATADGVASVNYMHNKQTSA